MPDRALSPETVRRLDELFRAQPLLFGGTATADDVAAAERSLGTTFDPCYAEFLTRYGAAMVGSLPVYGVRCAEVMGDELVVDVTMRFRRAGWPNTEDWIVISTDLGGNPIGLTTLGEVFTFDHDFDGTHRIAPTFETFLMDQLTERRTAAGAGPRDLVVGARGTRARSRARRSPELSRPARPTAEAPA